MPLFERYRKLEEESSALKSDEDLKTYFDALEVAGKTADEIHADPKAIKFLDRLKEIETEQEALQTEAEPLVEAFDARVKPARDVLRSIEKLEWATARAFKQAELDRMHKLREQYTNQEATETYANWYINTVILPYLKKTYNSSHEAFFANVEQLFRKALIQGTDGLDRNEYWKLNDYQRSGNIGSADRGSFITAAGALALQETWSNLIQSLEASGVYQEGASTLAQKQAFDRLTAIEFDKGAVTTLFGEDTYGFLANQLAPEEHSYKPSKASNYLKDGVTPLMTGYGSHHAIQGLLEGVGVKNVIDPLLAAELDAHIDVTVEKAPTFLLDRYHPDIQKNPDLLATVKELTLALAQLKNPNLRDRIRYAADTLTPKDIGRLNNLLATGDETVIEMYLLSLVDGAINDAQAEERIRGLQHLHELGLPMDYDWNGFNGKEDGKDKVFLLPLLRMPADLQGRWVTIIRSFEALSSDTKNALQWFRGRPQMGIDWYEEALTIYQREGETALYVFAQTAGARPVEEEIGVVAKKALEITKEGGLDEKLYEILGSKQGWVRHLANLEPEERTAFIRRVRDIRAAGVVDIQRYYKLTYLFYGHPDCIETFCDTVITHGKKIVGLIGDIAEVFGSDPDKFNAACRGAGELWSIPAFQELYQTVGVHVGEFITELLTVPVDQREKCIQLIIKLDQAPSQSIQRVKFQLAREIAASANPEAAYEKIVDVFVRNNLPPVGKIFRVFEILHSRELLDGKLQQKDLSPTLKAEGHYQRMVVLYKDLLKTHLASGNRELFAYFDALEHLDGVEQIENVQTLQGLPDDQRTAWIGTVSKLLTLVHNSLSGKQLEKDVVVKKDAPLEEIFAHYQELKADLQILPGQSIKERIEEMFLKPLGLGSMAEARAFRDQKKHATDERNRRLTETAIDGKIALREGDMLKGFDHNFFGAILQNGSVAKEFLGSSADSDYTPLDTDLSLVLPEDAELGFETSVKRSIAQGYGKIIMCVRPKEGMVHTSSTDDQGGLRTQARARTTEGYEYFKTGVLGERHMGIRTGFPMTEVDFLIVNEAPPSAKTVRNLSMELVMNGYYIPLVDGTGKILFTPEAFDALKEQFCRGITSLDQPAFEVHANPGLEEKLKPIREEIAQTEPILEAQRRTVEQVVRDVLQEVGALSEDQPLQLEDTGSSGRSTGIPGAVDFDLILKLDPVAKKNASEIQNRIAQRLGGKANGGNQDGQLRLVDVPVNGALIEVDIAFVSQSEVRSFESHDAVRERLQNIRTEAGEAAFRDVQAQIVYAKRLLKAANAYKKTEHGGLGGIGVENWILANHGNFTEAAQTFLAAATKEDGSRRTLTEFKDRYPLIDPGVNAKYAGTHDDFTFSLTDAGYENMIKALEEALK